MKYMGSKARIAKYILPIILKNRQKNQWYVEPFVGGANIIDKVDGNRIGVDNNIYLIEALKLIRDTPNNIPDLITENMYKESKDYNNKALKGFIGFSMSFGGKWFGGYRRDIVGTAGCIKNMKTQTRRSKENALKQSEKLQGVKLVCCSYNQIIIPKNSIIYCDPPYENTTKYKDKFDHDKFWQWCREKSKEGHKIFISEYNSPDDFESIWEREITCTLTKDKRSKKSIEKLFIYKSN